MSDTSAIRDALGGYVEKKNQGDNSALRSALNDLKYTVKQNVYATPYPSTPAPAAPTTPTQPTTPTTPTNTAGAVQLPASVSGAPTVTYAPQTTQTTQPQDFFQSLEQKTDAGIESVAGMLGTDTSNPFARVGGFLMGAAQGVGDVLGNVGGAINDIPVVGDWAESAGKAVGQGLEFYNENVNEPAAGIGAALLPYTSLAGQNALVGQAITANLMGNPERAGRLLQQAQNPMDFAPLVSDAAGTIGAQALDKLTRGDIAGAAQGLLDTFHTYGKEQYNKLDPATALAAALIFDPLNFVPGFGVGKMQKAGKLAEITQDIGRIENIAELAPKGFMGKVATPAAKVTEVVKSALQNIGLRTQYADNAEDMFNTYRAFEKAGADAKGFDAIVSTYAGMKSIPAQRAQKLIQGMGKQLDEVENAYRMMVGALNGTDTLSDTSKLPKNFKRFLDDATENGLTEADALEFLKAEMASRTSKYFAEQGAKLFPVKGMAAPVKIADRFMNELRGFESLVFIGLSPMTFARNVINGITTMAIEGVNPIWDAGREIARLKKIGQGGRAMELERAIKFQEEMMGVGRNVREAMGLGTVGTGQTGYFGNFMSKMIKGTPVGKPLQWYARMENAMRAHVWSQTYYRALQHNWDVGKFIPEMDAVTQAVLHQYRVDPQQIMGIVREAGSHDKKAVAAEVLKYLRGQRGTALDLNQLAAEMGITKRQLQSFLDEKDMAKAQGIAQEISARVANGMHPAQAANDVIGQAARETAESVSERTGQTLEEAAPIVNEASATLAELEARRGELVQQWATASASRGGRKLADDLAAQIEAVEREMERLGFEAGQEPTGKIFENVSQETRDVMGLDDVPVEQAAPVPAQGIDDGYIVDNTPSGTEINYEFDEAAQVAEEAAVIAPTEVPTAPALDLSAWRAAAENKIADVPDSLVKELFALKYAGATEGAQRGVARSLEGILGGTSKEYAGLSRQQLAQKIIDESRAGGQKWMDMLADMFEQQAHWVVEQARNGDAYALGKMERLANGDALAKMLRGRGFDWQAFEQPFTGTRYRNGFDASAFRKQWFESRGLQFPEPPIVKPAKPKPVKPAGRSAEGVSGGIRGAERDAAATSGEVSGTGSINDVAQAAPKGKQEFILWGKRKGEGQNSWVKLTHDTSNAEMARREKDGWDVLRYQKGESPNIPPQAARTGAETGAVGGGDVVTPPTGKEAYEQAQRELKDAINAKYNSPSERADAIELAREKVNTAMTNAEAPQYAQYPIGEKVWFKGDEYAIVGDQKQINGGWYQDAERADGKKIVVPTKAEAAKTISQNKTANQEMQAGFRRLKQADTPSVPPAAPTPSAPDIGTNAYFSRADESFSRLPKSSVSVSATDGDFVILSDGTKRRRMGQGTQKDVFPLDDTRVIKVSRQDWGDSYIASEANLYFNAPPDVQKSMARIEGVGTFVDASGNARKYLVMERVSGIGSYHPTPDQMNVVESYLGKGDYGWIMGQEGKKAKQWGRTDDGRVVLSDLQNFKAAEEDVLLAKQAAERAVNDENPIVALLAKEGIGQNFYDGLRNGTQSKEDVVKWLKQRESAGLGGGELRSKIEVLPEGKPVPAEVLADYPDLAKATKASATGAKPVEPFTLEERRALREESDAIQKRLFKKDGTPKAKQSPEDLARWDEIKQKGQQWQDYLDQDQKFLANEKINYISKKFGLRVGEPAEIDWGGNVGTIRGKLNISGYDVTIDRSVIPESRWGEIKQGTTDAARIADDIPAGQVFNEQALYGEIEKQINAIDEIERLRRVAAEDADAVRILSRDEMLKSKARTQADMYDALMRMYSSEGAQRVRVGTDAENRVMGWLRRDVFNGMDESRAAAQVAADWMDNAVMISRDGETHFDAALNWLSPFQFWGTRYAIQSARRVADKPARLAWYLKLRDAQDQVENDPRFPKRLRGMMELPFPGVPGWAGGKMWFDPLEMFTQVESVFKLNQFEDTLTDSDVAQAIRALVESGSVSPQEAANAIANKGGALWDSTKAQMEDMTKSTEGLDSITNVFKPHLPFDIIWKLRTGDAANIGVMFPMTRLIRNATSALPKGSFLNPTGTGINIEQPLKAGLRALTGNQNIPDWDAWEQYRVDRALADMVGDGTITERDALLAMIERRGGWYDEALTRAQNQMRGQNFTSVFGGQMFPEGEREYYRARVERDQLIDQTVAQLGGNPADMSYGEKMDIIRANGLNKRGTPLGDFYTKNPVLASRQDAYNEPEGRLKGFLTDELWQKYMALSALDKRMARQGNKELADFITNPERNYDAVTLEKAAGWVKYLRGYLPEAEQTPKVGALNQISFAPPDQSARYQNILDTQGQMFDLEAMQPKLDAYQKMTPTEKRTFRAVNPDVDAYFKWYGSQMKANPDIDKLIHPDTQNAYASAYSQQSTNNYLTSQLVKNLNRMVGKLDDSRARRFNPKGRGTPDKPRPLSRAAVMAIQQKRTDPNYYFPRNVYRELIAAFKASGLRMSFEQWLQMMAMQGGV